MSMWKILKLSQIILLVALSILLLTSESETAFSNGPKGFYRRTKSSQEYDDGIVPIGEYKSEKDYTEWISPTPSYIETSEK